jgi:hypothetical protein
MSANIDSQNKQPVVDETPVVDFREEDKKDPIKNDDDHDLLEELQKEIKQEPVNKTDHALALDDKNAKLTTEIKEDEGKLNDNDDPLEKEDLLGNKQEKGDENEAAYKKLFENRDKTLQQKEYSDKQGRNIQAEDD